MTRFIVVRHGFSIANKAKCFAGHVDRPLNEIGKAQAAHVAAYLAANERIDKIICSGLTRTRQTAAPIAEHLGLPVHEDASLRELFAGLWENMPYGEIDRLYHDDWMIWCYDIARSRCTGGESIREHYARIERAVHRIAEDHDGQTLLLVTHCTPVRVMCAMAAGVPWERFQDAPPAANASIHVFIYEDGILRCEKSNLITYPRTLLSWRRFPHV
jgi:probable phosphoglycerate mutase